MKFQKDGEIITAPSHSPSKNEKKNSEEKSCSTCEALLLPNPTHLWCADICKKFSGYIKKVLG